MLKPIILSTGILLCAFFTVNTVNAASPTNQYVTSSQFDPRPEEEINTILNACCDAWELDMDEATLLYEARVITIEYDEQDPAVAIARMEDDSIVVMISDQDY